MNQFVSRNRYNIQRFRTIVITSTLILTILFLIVGAFYPGDSGAEDLIETFKETGLAAIYGLADVNAVGWLFWLALISNTYLYFVPVITAILVGSRLIPTQNNDGLELLFASSPRNPRKFILENFVSGAQILLIVILPSFIIIMIFTWYFASLEIIDRIALTFFLAYLVSFIFMSVVAAITTIKFSNSSGKKIGFGYLVFCFFFELMIQSSDNLGDFGNISLNYYIGPSNALLYPDYELSKILVGLFLAFLGILVSVYFVNRHDFIEKISEPKNNKSGTTRFHPNSNLGKKYPFIAEQLRRDFKFLIWNIGLVAFFIFYIIVVYPGDENTGDIFTSFQSPVLDALLFNNTISFDYTGFIVVEFYAYFYLYFGIFVTFVSASIGTKETRDNYQDIIWANNFKPDKIMNSRVLTMIIETTILFWSSFIFLNIFEMIFGYSSPKLFMNSFTVFFINWIFYITYGLIIVTITMSFQLSESKKYAIWAYLGFILIILVAFLSDYEFLRYTSYFGYIDNAGYMLEKTSPLQGFISIIFMVPISALLYRFTLQRIYWNKDLI